MLLAVNIASHSVCMEISYILFHTIHTGWVLWVTHVSPTLRSNSRTPILITCDSRVARICWSHLCTLRTIRTWHICMADLTFAAGADTHSGDYLHGAGSHSYCNAQRKLQPYSSVMAHQNLCLHRCSIFPDSSWRNASDNCLPKSIHRNDEQ